MMLNAKQQCGETKRLLPDYIRAAAQGLGEEHIMTLRLRLTLEEARFKDNTATLDDVRAAVESLSDLTDVFGRVFGGGVPLPFFGNNATHPQTTLTWQVYLQAIRKRDKMLFDPAATTINRCVRKFLESRRR